MRSTATKYQTSPEQLEQVRLTTDCSLVILEEDQRAWGTGEERCVSVSQRNGLAGSPKNHLAQITQRGRVCCSDKQSCYLADMQAHLFSQVTSEGITALSSLLCSFFPLRWLWRKLVTMEPSDKEFLFRVSGMQRKGCNREWARQRLTV